MVCKETAHECQTLGPFEEKLQAANSTEANKETEWKQKKKKKNKSCTKRWQKQRIPSIDSVHINTNIKQENIQERLE